ncbi:hypothetical protein Tco_1197295 [Tanacetum coccineum]
MKPNKDLLKQCIEKGPYVFVQVRKAVEDGNTKHKEEFIAEIYQNTTDAVQKLIDAKAEVVHMILNGIGNDIYSTVDACTNAKEMWIAIECLQQRESINIQDVKKKLFWEFTKLTSRDGESIESYYTRFYRMMKEMVVLNATDDNSGPTYDTEPLEKVQSNDDYNAFTTERQQSKQLESINDTYVVEKVDSNVISDLSDMSTNEREVDQNAEEPEDECVLLASLIANLKLDVDENKKIHKQLKQGNTSLTQELDKSKRSLRDYKIDLSSKCSISFANLEYLKKAQWEKPGLYKVKYDKHDLANLFAPKNVTKTYEVMKFQNDIKVLVKDLLIPLAERTLTNSAKLEKPPKDEMREDLKYVKTLEQEVDDLKKDIDDLQS